MNEKYSSKTDLVFLNYSRFSFFLFLTSAYKPLIILLEIVRSNINLSIISLSNSLVLKFDKH